MSSLENVTLKGRSGGFTFIELLVDIAILLVLIGMMVFLIDPIKQLNKGKDAQRKEDFKQIRNALDTYYNDFNCYPTDIPFGQEWRVNDAVYMKKVPQDPNCNGSNLCYTYVYDETSSCPQWNVLFGELTIAPAQSSPACQLQNDCLPLNYSSLGYNLCDFGGNIDCSYLSNMTLQPPVMDFPSPTPNDQNTSQLSPTPSIPYNPNDGVFYCACGNDHVTVCNITFNPPINVQIYYDSACSNQCGAPC